MKKDLNNSVTKLKINTSWWKLAGVVFFCWMVMIYMDNVQQNQYESVREAYEQMEKEKYQIAM